MVWSVGEGEVGSSEQEGNPLCYSNPKEAEVFGY